MLTPPVPSIHPPPDRLLPPDPSKGLPPVLRRRAPLVLDRGVQIPRATAGQHDVSPPGVRR
jgi:hypothetical protein